MIPAGVPALLDPTLPRPPLSHSPARYYYYYYYYYCYCYYYYYYYYYYYCDY
jgi:hypothetical protein